MPKDVMSDLIEMSHALGDPVNDFAILGEGNTSARIDEDSFYVKASGTELRTMAPEGFVQVRFAKVLELLDAEDTSDEVVKQVFEEASVDAEGKRPSTEALMHAILLSMDGVDFAGHTHPTAINQFTCAVEGRQAWQGRLFPDEIVCCGIAPVWVPYTDPGIPLAREVKKQVEAYIEEYAVRPKVILIQNHGLIAIGGTPAEVINATMMMCKTARVLWGTYALGGPHYLTDKQTERIFTWPSEKYRAQLLEKKS